MPLSLEELTDLAHHANMQISDVCERVVALCDEPGERYALSLIAMMASHRAFSEVMRMDENKMRGPFAGLSERDSWLAVICTMQLMNDQTPGVAPDDPVHFVHCLVKMQKTMKGIHIQKTA